MVRKESTTRTGFSFANAAGSLNAETAADEDKAEDEVEQVSNGVSKVAV